MVNRNEWKLIPEDRTILRELARRYMEIAQQPAMEERRKLWVAHNDLRECRPLVLIESLTEGLRAEIFNNQPPRCQEDWARKIENHLRGQIHHFTVIQDDDVLKPFFDINWFVDMGDWGVEFGVTRATDATGTQLGYHVEPPLKDFPNDFGLLKERRFSVDREKTLAWKAHLENVFDGILPVRIRGAFWWTMGMTWRVIDLVGLQQLMMHMYECPDDVHRLMRYMCDDHLRLADFCEREGLLSLNNAEDYIGSGSRGFTQSLPQPDFQPGAPVRLKDTWALIESQETVGVSPETFAEFVLPYQRELAERFGLVYYGCCEPVNGRWKYLESFPNLRSVSVSPWADENLMAEALGRRFVYSRKPSPSELSTDHFDEEAVRAGIRNTLTVARGCNVELVMKDLHSTRGNPQRLARWVQICREEIQRGG